MSPDEVSQCHQALKWFIKIQLGNVQMPFDVQHRPCNTMVQQNANGSPFSVETEWTRASQSTFVPTRPLQSIWLIDWLIGWRSQKENALQHGKWPLPWLLSTGSLPARCAALFLTATTCNASTHHPPSVIWPKVHMYVSSPALRVCESCV